MKILDYLENVNFLSDSKLLNSRECVGLCVQNGNGLKTQILDLD